MGGKAKAFKENNMMVINQLSGGIQ